MVEGSPARYEQISLATSPGNAELREDAEMPTEPWTTADADDLYLVSRWGNELFEIGDNGNLIATPKGPAGGKLDLKQLIDELQERGIGLPVLLRFTDVLGKRISDVSNAFQSAITQYEYKGRYQPVVPIKVNQQKHVVQELLEMGRPYNLGLEAGSKPELLAAIGMVEDHESMIICNGYKDFEYLETALLSRKLGLNTIVICDRYREIEALIHLKNKRSLSGPLGIRVKLNARGAGRWAESGGDKSKFGLSAAETIRAVEVLEKEGMLDQLKVIHFHIGSQIPSIRAVTRAVQEAARIYVNLHQLGAKIEFIDIGGGLAVDYDGSRTNFSSSMNYTVSEYASDVVSEIGSICDKNGVPHPTILSESGRALMAHHAVLVYDVLDVNEQRPNLGRKGSGENGLPEIPEGSHELLGELRAIYGNVTNKNYQESFNDAVTLNEQLINLFSLGYCTLKDRAIAEDIVRAIIGKIDAMSEEFDYIPEDLERALRKLNDTYYCNFSVFQSVPDSWAVGALFPIVPLQRLNEKPDRRAVIADLTCDSDGKIARFIDLHDVKTNLPLHSMNDQPYYLGTFLVGAYQETLGDLHNLFGDTEAVHVSLDSTGNYHVTHHVIGDTVADVLGYVEYDTKDLIRRVRMATEAAVKAGRMNSEEVRLLMRRYETGLAGYTYLEGEEQMLL